DGKIKQIGTGLKAPRGTKVIDAEGLNVYPGLVECHGHIGLDGWAMGYEGADYNEYTDPVTPQLRAIDGLNPQDYSLKDAALGGVTTLCTGPGSSNVLGGTFAAFKPIGKCIDDMVIKPEAAMKCAFGENPKRCYRDKSITSRMSTAAKLREMLFKAREYDRKIQAAGDDESKLPAFDMRLNALLPVIRGEMPLKAHAHQANDILTAIRIAKEFGVKLTLEHVTDGALIADELVKANVPLAIGPTDGQPSKIELKNKSWETPGILAKAGCKVSIITDSPVTIQSHLRLCAALAIKSGMDRFDALKAITINPANHIGVADRVGSLEIGKDADFVLTDGCIFEIQTHIVATYINGVKVEKD
ncbi:MAG: amidohydrolase, partial [Clostridia bacterium]|nr:amidohydrolase [Clostridia bacterium]